MIIHVVDAFTQVPFRGNPAGVSIVEEFPSPERMQDLAREMNLSETAFAARRTDGDYDLRWFTPTVEVDLCGHATLASAHVLGGTARFHTRSGLLTTRGTTGSLIEMDFPADPLRQVPKPAQFDGIEVGYCGMGISDLLVELPSAPAVRDFKPDLTRLASLGTRCVIITAPGDSAGTTCVSRVFAVNAGVAEDPVTGSSHCTIAGFWADRLGVVDLVGEQASARGGVVYMRVAGDRVILGGYAVTVSEVHILV